MSSYYFAIGNDRKGPCTLDELRVQGLRPQTLVWAEGMADWQPASSVPELAPLLAAPPSPELPPPLPPPFVQYASPMTGAPPYNQADINSKKVLAGLMGIFFGGMGLHKFVLGFTTSGIIMLLVSLLGACFTFGLSAMAMGVIGLIEGIMYLTKTDEEFYRLYIVEKKEWF